jgi:hypothetical protein
MKFDKNTRSARWLREMLHEIFQPRQDAPSTGRKIGQWTRQGLAVVLSALMILIPMMQGEAFAQSVPMPGDGQSTPGLDDGQPVPQEQPVVPQGQPLSAEQLNQLVAPIALYPDALVAQVLAASTYPTQVVEADRWRQAQGSAPADQIAAGAEAKNWDPSVKALTAFPTVLAQMDRNLRWTTDLGNAYYNQPQDVMDSVQTMRQKAQTAGQLRSTPQQTVASADGAITIAPANPTMVYVPVYNPWTIYGSPFPVYPGYYYAPPPGVFWGGLAIGFGVGIGIGLFAPWGWGWGHWGMGWGPRWGGHGVFYNHSTYVTRSTTVVNRGFNRPGGPPRNFGARGAYARPAGGVNRAGVSRPGGPGANSSRATVNHSSVPRPSGSVSSHSTPGANSSRASVNHSSVPRPSGSVGSRPSSGSSASRPSVNHGSVPRPGGSSSGSGRPSAGSHPSGGGHPSGSGGHSGGHKG